MYFALSRFKQKKGAAVKSHDMTEYQPRFPPEERAMATAVALLSNWLGVSGSLVVGQAVVTEMPGENLTMFHSGDSSALPDTELIRLVQGLLLLGFVSNLGDTGCP